MKKFLAAILVVVMLAGFATVTAGASSYDSSAKELNKLGLLQGTDAGFDLDAKPTRVQAVVMLIRLLGLEEDAKTAPGSIGFTDVPEWAVPYVGYAYANNLAKGVTETEFNPDGLCSAQMYVTFMLRALGYSDGEDGDFTYADAIAFGTEVGIVDATLTQGDFLRDQMVAISYLALLTAPNNGDFDTLLDALVESGAVTQEAAEGFAARLLLIAEVTGLGSELADVTSIEIGLDAKGSISMLGQDVPLTMKANAKVAMGDDIQAAVTADMDAAGETLKLECYLKDGIAYVNAADEKIKVDLGQSDILAAVMGGQTADAASAVAVAAMYEDVAKTTEGDYTVYTVTMNGGLLNAVLAMTATATPDTDMSMNMGPVKFYTDKDGALKKITVAMDMAIKQVDGETSVDMKIELELAIEILATGDAVKITFPTDLGTYVETDLGI